MNEWMNLFINVSKKYLLCYAYLPVGRGGNFLCSSQLQWIYYTQKLTGRKKNYKQKQAINLHFITYKVHDMKTS